MGQMETQRRRQLAKEEFARKQQLSQEEYEREHYLDLPQGLAEDINLPAGRTRTELLTPAVNVMQQKSKTDIANKKAQIAARKLQGHPNSFNTLTPQDVVDNFYVNQLGRTPPTDPMTLAQFQTVLRAHGIELNEYFKELGVDLKLGRTAFGEIEPKMKEVIEKKRETKKLSSPTLNTDAYSEYPTKQSVADAFKANKITEEKARQILQEKFNIK